LNSGEDPTTVKGTIMRALHRLLPGTTSGRTESTDQTIDHIAARSAETRAFLRAYEERVAIDRRLACPTTARPTRGEDRPEWISPSSTGQ
jgi:hypothetical protein